MFYYEEKATKKPKDVALILNTTSDKVSEWAKDLENYGIIKFSRTPFGSLLFKESEIKLIREYGVLKNTFGNPKDAMDIIKKSSNIPNNEDDDMSWTKDLNDVIWRRH
jgi:hypothetical protein